MSKQYLTADDLNEAEKLLGPDYYFVLTSYNHFGSYLVRLANFFLTGKWGYYSHIIMNIDTDTSTRDTFKFVESTPNRGVTVSNFDEAFADDCKGFAIIKPKNMPVDRWTAVLDKANRELGKPYNTLFNLDSSKALNCVQLVREALVGEPDYYTNFAGFERIIEKYHNLTPDMFLNCGDFEVVYESRR